MSTQQPSKLLHGGIKYFHFQLFFLSEIHFIPYVYRRFRWYHVYIYDIRYLCSCYDIIQVTRLKRLAWKLRRRGKWVYSYDTNAPKTFSLDTVMWSWSQRSVKLTGGHQRSQHAVANETISWTSQMAEMKSSDLTSRVSGDNWRQN